ncbi:YdcF family protein [Reichenbachiella sp. 5M10]|uniref:YdcF family protein n=1 Tax=Reichenbachiella sp. 5M10 TaxID=1889772 RepID=UPI0013042535|nr:YdcF family protein [Reichenbachiella sp. 5M10]
MTRGIFVLLLLLPLSSCLISQDNCKELLVEAEAQTFDVVVVPGIPYKDGSWDMLMQGRVYWSKYLYDRGIAKHIMYSGSSVYSPYYEAKIMALYAAKIGIPDSVIFTEIRAEHSTENIYYSYKKAKNLGFESVALATDPFQAKMLRRFINKKVDTSIALIPFVYDTLSQVHQDSVILINDSSAYNPTYVSLVKRESQWKRMMGTRGKNINESYYENGALEEE